jgi:L-aminopeptidase/D-esterase-like protein
MDNRSLTHKGLTDVPGLRVGHAQDSVGLTGCTVVLCEAGAIGGVDVRGGAPGTRETDLLRPLHLVQQVHGLLLSGGSAFGLDAATGVMRYLEERGVGFDAGVARVPIVPAAVLFDLNIADARVRPDANMGYRACEAATTGPVAEGNVGAGCGATVGKSLGPQQATKSGLGTASICLAGGLVVSALVAVNALGSVIDPSTGLLLAGPRHPETGQLLGTLELMTAGALPYARPFSNTTIGVVATNAILSKEQANKMAEMAQDGVARAIRPAHTLYDGDTIFALATGDIPADASLVGALAAEVVARAIVRGVRGARAAGGLPASSDLVPNFPLPGHVF